MNKKVMLIIMDGWGYGKDYPGNAVKLANTPVFDKNIKMYPNTSIKASGLDVGLPEGQMGNSEVGHMNIGAGRIIYQDLTLISKEIEEGVFYNNQYLVEAVKKAKENNKALHLIGLSSYGGVHSHLTHLFALLELAKKHDLKQVYVHAILDGRDVSPTAGVSDIKDLQNKVDEIGYGKIATVIGRYYAMDRDKRWDRTQLAYRAITLGEGKQVTDPIASIQEEYDKSTQEKNTTDEFMTPTVIMENNEPVATLNDGDSVIFFNFRPDRARQFTRAIVDEDFDGFIREKQVHTHFVTMTTYDKTIENVSIAYPPKDIKNTFGDVVANHGLKQLRMAETEKYAHVTFFFNGGIEPPLEGEERILVPSPKVATYDLQPEMSAFELKDKAIERIKSEEPSAIILNFANPDMVGHTGIIEAAKKAVETVDQCVGEIVEVGLEHGYEFIITADHGNSEQLIDFETGLPFTAHTTNLVPVIYVTKDTEGVTMRDGGRLADLAPTMLDILGLEKPAEMTGKSLINRG
ncbi:2,3-bisphosphoglycerate-independent phosphoglycerate mutase [Helcococcus kunzii]|uniref:2,3-bisphosphoglycerate-independent phosphoglycerate mutase n=1 Tax=Helcococcus kunzii TaxID=40091 RepID=UPI00389F2F72